MGREAIHLENKSCVSLIGTGCRKREESYSTWKNCGCVVDRGIEAWADSKPECCARWRNRGTESNTIMYWNY